MNLKMKVSIAGGYPPNSYSYKPGEVIEFDDERGKAWVAGGNAVVAEKHEQPVAVHPPDPKPEKKEPSSQEKQDAAEKKAKAEAESAAQQGAPENAAQPAAKKKK